MQYNAPNTVAFQRNRLNNYPFCGRLIVLDNTNSTRLKDPFNISTQAFSINFPAMPESIELARKSEYKVTASMFMPDGVHQYMLTSPMKIPFSFKIHHNDEEYCQEGPFTLLKLAAQLHSLILPLGDHTLPISVLNNSPLKPDGSIFVGAPPPKNEPVVNRRAGQAAPPTPAAPAASDSLEYVESGVSIDPPVAVRLELIVTESNSPGIVCTGYIEDVKVVLYGPWLRGPGISSNLPSSAEYSFTFVHLPGHGNFFSNRGGKVAFSVFAQAYAQFIRDRLYNTRDLTTDSQYRGWLTTRPG